MRVFTRNRNDVTASAPEIVEAVRAQPGSGADPRRRGHRAPAERRAAAVSGHDAPLRANARRRRRCARRCRCRCSSSIACTSARTPLTEAPVHASVSRRSRARCLPQLLMPRLVTDDAAAGGALLRRRASPRTRRRDGEVADAPYEAGRRARVVAQDQAAAHAGSRRAGGRVGQWPAQGLPVQPPSRRARRGQRRLRDARQDVQGHDRRDARVADARRCSRARLRATR